MSMQTAQARGTFTQEESDYSSFDRQLLRRLLGYLLLDRRRVLISMLGVLGISGFGMAQPAVIGIAPFSPHSVTVFPRLRINPTFTGSNCANWSAATWLTIPRKSTVGGFEPNCVMHADRGRLMRAGFMKELAR